VQRTIGALPSTMEVVMLYSAAAFFVIAIVAGIFGFFGIAAAIAGVAKVLFVLFLALALASFCYRMLHHPHHAV
jgi:uncharacterized membrane protein YtjA (UPF0391 family)